VYNLRPMYAPSVLFPEGLFVQGAAHSALVPVPVAREGVRVTSATARRETVTGSNVLTIEAVLYCACGGLMLLWRLTAIGGGFLSPGEARQALAAYHLAQGSRAAAEAAGASSPGLLALQALAFTLFAANDAWARMVTVLLSSSLPLAFWCLRPLLGRSVALGALVLLVFSPLWTAMGTQALGAAVSATAVLLALGFASQAVARNSVRWLAACGAAAAVGVSCTAEAWSLLVLLPLIGALLWRDGFDVPPVLRRWQPFGISFVVTLLVLATVGGLYPLGLQAVIDLPAVWIASFFQRDAGSLFDQVLLFSVYEPLLLTFALVTVALIVPSNSWWRALYLWATGGILLALLNGRPSAVLFSLPPLAMLAAQSVTLSVEMMRHLDGRTRLEGAVALVGLLGYGYVAVSGVARLGQTVFLVLALTALGIGLALLGLAWTRSGPRAAMALLAMAVLVLLGPWEVANAAQGAWQRRQTPEELLYSEVAGEGLNDLLQDIRELSWSRARGATTLPLLVERDVGPLLEWYLRDMRNISWVDKLPVTANSEAIISAGSEPLELSMPYLGQDYVVVREWEASFANAQSFLRWVLYREGDGGHERRVTLWVRE